MPADRQIIVSVQATGSRDEHGEYVPGPSTDIRTWASKRDRSAEDVATEGGQRGETRRDWRVRWDSRIVATLVSLLSVTDDGQIFNVLNVVEPTRQGRGQADLRRRFLDLQGVSTT